MSIAYSVVAVVTGFSSTDAAYNTMSQSLTAAVIDTSYTTLLWANAQANGNVALQSAVALSIQTANAITTPPTGSPSPHSGLNAGAMAAIVVTIIVLVLVASLLLRARLKACLQGKAEVRPEKFEKELDNMGGGGTSPIH